MPDLRKTMGFDPRAWNSTIDFWFMREGARIAVLTWFIRPYHSNGIDRAGVKLLAVYDTSNGHHEGQRLWETF